MLLNLLVLRARLASGESRGGHTNTSFFSTGVALGFSLGGQGSFLIAWFLPRRDFAFAQRFLPTALKEKLTPCPQQRAASSCTAAGLSRGSHTRDSPPADLRATGLELPAPLGPPSSSAWDPSSHPHPVLGPVASCRLGVRVPREYLWLDEELPWGPQPLGCCVLLCPPYRKAEHF